MAHFLSPELQLRHVLLAVREIEGLHSGENMAESLLTVITDYEISTRIGVFVSDNVSLNNVITRIILSRLEINNNSSHRARCLGHIINLAAQAFLSGTDEASVQAEQSSSQQVSHLEAQLRFWRQKGAKGKFHNTCCFIRKTPQRRESFQMCLQATKLDSEDLVEGE